MGFSNVWTIIDNPAAFLTPHEQATLNQDLVYDGPADAAPYLLIDVNNVTGPKTGNVLLSTAYLLKFWRAVYASGFRIRCFRDGRHKALRGVTKLQRMSNDLSYSQTGPSVTNETFSGLSAQSAGCYTSNQEMKRLNEVIDQTGQIDATRTRCEQEADADIRVLARKLHEEGHRVVIISSDASLLVGIPNEVNIMCPRRSTFTTHDTPLLNGPIVPISLFVRALNRYVVKVLPREVKTEHVVLDEFCFLIIAALLGGEEDRAALSDRCNPYHITKFFSIFLFDYNRDIAPDSPIAQHATRNLIAAATLVWLWKKSLNINIALHDITSSKAVSDLEDIIGSLISEVTRAAHQYSRSGHQANTAIFNLHKQNKDSIFMAAKRANEISPLQVRDTMLQRLCDSMDVTHGSSSVLLYRCYWGSWISCYEPPHCDTELLLNPIRSLREQVKDIRGLFDVSQLPDVEANEHVSVEELNNWVDEVHELASDYAPSNIHYWKSHKVLQPQRIPQALTYDITSLHNYVVSHGHLPERGYLGNMGFTVLPTNSFHFHRCAASCQWTNQSGVLRNLAQRKQFLIDLASESIAQDDILIRATAGNIAESQSLAGDIAVLWRSMLSAQNSSEAAKLQHFAADSARGVIALLHVLVSCFHQSDDFTSATIGHLFDACICSMLFTSATNHQIPLTGNNECSTQISAWEDSVENALQVIRPSLRSGPLGDISAARWTELTDIILKMLCAIAGRDHTLSASAWFDACGFCSVLRAASEGILVLTTAPFQSLLLVGKTDIADKMPHYNAVKQRAIRLLSEYHGDLPPINLMNAMENVTLSTPDITSLPVE